MVYPTHPSLMYFGCSKVDIGSPWIPLGSSLTLEKIVIFDTFHLLEDRCAWFFYELTLIHHNVPLYQEYLWTQEILQPEENCSSSNFHLSRGGWHPGRGCSLTAVGHRELAASGPLLSLIKKFLSWRQGTNGATETKKRRRCNFGSSSSSEVRLWHHQTHLALT